MEYITLGNTGIKVSKLCFGSLTISPLQANLPVEDGSNIIKHAYSKGINFIDTAELYYNYSYLKRVFKDIKREKFVVSTKSYSYSKKTAEYSLKKALKEIGTDYIDLFLLHEQESEHTIRGHYEAIEYFLKAKEKGIIRAIGISTHKVQAVYAATKYDEIEIIHPIFNKSGLGILDGDINEMAEAIKKAHNKGKGIYGMKPLGGGHLINNVEDAFNFVINNPYLHSIAVGMQSKDEIDANISFMTNKFIPNKIKNRLKRKKRELHVAEWCIGCGSCMDMCQHSGIKIINNKAQPIKNKCILCGYCAINCPEFCIKVY